MSKNKPKLCVLQSSNEDCRSELANVSSYANLSEYFPKADFVNCYIHKGSEIAQIVGIKLEQGPFELYINLCNGAKEEDRAGIEVIAALEKLNLPYTGADEQFYEPTRATQKRVAEKLGISTPRHVFVYFADELDATPSPFSDLRFPLIVKHHNSYGSIGLTPASRCENEKEARIQCLRMIELYGGALVEEFIEGREFVVLVYPGAENYPTCCAPLEYTFPPGETFFHFDQKHKGVKVVAPTDPSEAILMQTLKDMTTRMFKELGGVGYARSDIRVDNSGKPYLLEINPNCSVFTPGKTSSCDRILARYDDQHAYFFNIIFINARERWRKKNKH